MPKTPIPCERCIERLGEVELPVLVHACPDPHPREHQRQIMGFDDMERRLEEIERSIRWLKSELVRLEAMCPRT